MPSIATLTVSDSRSLASDLSGPALREALSAAGVSLGSHALVRDDPNAILAALHSALSDHEVWGLVITGGTGIGPRDLTIESITPLFEKQVDGFGEAFRRLSWDQVGVRSILSRATAGLVGGKLVFAVPGNPNAVRLAVEQLIGPLWEHAEAMLGGHGH